MSNKVESMSTNIRALPVPRTTEAANEDAAAKAVEAIRLLIRQEIHIIESERNASPEPVNEELTVEEVARIKKVKPRTIYDWIKAEPPKIKFHRTPSGRLRFYRRDVEA